MNTTRTLKESVKSNLFIVITTALFVAASEILTGIMRYDLYYDEIGPSEFFGSIIFRILAIPAGFILPYYFGRFLHNKFSVVVAATATIFIVIRSFENRGYINDFFYNIFFVLALLSLSFYYITSCRNSLAHTICYYIISTALAAATFDKIEFFIVLVTILLIFASNRVLIKRKFVLIVNSVFAIAAIILSACMFADKMDAYLGITFIEGSTIHPERVMLALEQFGKSENFSTIAEAPSIYNLTKIFGYYGNIAGAATCAVIALFVSGFIMKCFKGPSRTKTASLVASIIVSIKCLAGIFENFAIISGLYVGIPVLSEGSGGYFIIGILLGFLLAPLRIPKLLDSFIMNIEYKISGV